MSTTATRATGRQAGHELLPALETYFRSIDETPLLTRAEEKALARRVAEGDSEARDLMARANLRLVVRIARGYLGRGLELPDLIAEGNLGLLRAVEGYDASLETRFSTYASFWIKQSIKRAVINGGKTIRLPAYTVQLLVEWRRASARVQARLGRAGTTEEIGGELGLSKRKLAIVRRALEVNNPAAASLEGPDEETMHEVLLDTQMRTPDAEAGEAEERQLVVRLLEDLDPREAMVVRMRFGLGDHEPRTFEEIGGRLGLTRERARQIQAEALRKLGERLQAFGAGQLPEWAAVSACSTEF